VTTSIAPVTVGGDILIVFLPYPPSH
jgi:hypothetical protein